MKTSDYLVAVNTISVQYLIFINKVEYWNKHHELADFDTVEEKEFLDEIMAEVNMKEIMPSYYTSTKSGGDTLDNMNNVKRALIARGFVYDEEFDKKVNEHF